MRPWDRREIVKAAGAAAVACGTPSRAGAIIRPPLSDIVIGDIRFAASRAFAENAANSGSRIVWTHGDITEFWYGELDLLWRREKVSLTGLTTKAPLFYLEQLAMDRGLRVILRTQSPWPEPQATRELLIGWMIAPKSFRRERA